MADRGIAFDVFFIASFFRRNPSKLAEQSFQRIQYTIEIRMYE